MAALSKKSSDSSDSPKSVTSVICNELFFETFPSVILYLQAFCLPSSCWELHYLLYRYLHRGINGGNNMMAVPVFGSMEHYLKKVNLNDSNVIRHLLVFGPAMTSLCFRENCSGEEHLSRVLFNHLTKNKADHEEIKKESQAFHNKLTGTEEIPVLRLRGSSGGDQERFLCEICGKILTSKRNLDLHVDSVHVSHPDFDCILSSNGLLKWKCSLCNNLLSSKQRIISHLVKTHGKTNLLGQGQKQDLNSRTTLWRRKRSADGTFVNQWSFFESNSPVDPPNLSYSAAANESVISDSPSKSEEGDIYVQTTGDIPDVEKELPVVTEYSQVLEQAEPSTSNDCLYGLDGPEFSLRKDTKLFDMDDLISSDNDCLSSDNDYSSSETETTSSEDSDFEDDEDQLQTTCSSDSVKELTEKEKLSVLILSYIAKHN